MADLSAVLRKTIDGLPNATPELRAKVYEKARAAILRQIENANPPLSDEDVSVRRSALEQAIRSTEAHYAAQSAAASLEEPAESPQPKAPPAPPPPPRPAAAPEMPASPHPARPTWARKSDGAGAPPSPTVEPPRMPRADANFERSSPFERSPAAVPERRPLGDPGGRSDRPDNQRGPASTEPAGGFDIPDADTSAPRYSGARNGRAGRSAKPLVLGVAAVVAIAALGAGGYLYGDRLTGLFGPSGDTQTAANAPSGAASNGEAGTQPSGNGDAANAPETGNTAAPNGEAAGEAPKRRFTQRLLADGSEVDEGPGSGASNAFDEGTNIAAATPEPTTAPSAPSAPGNPTAGAGVPPAQTAAVPPPTTSGATPAVAQKAMFYEERTAALQGTQQSGNVVWTLVNESPAEGQPPEPAIRAVADVPAEKLKMTMTIRRNLDPTLPASHVIELQFDVPTGFEGGQVANVQRLALKPSEEARGEPLIGVAGKISDGFFIIALNNLDKATETNLSLLGRQEWIDIPIAYATGRRALMSIEKGVPGDRIFKEAMEAWAAKT